MDKDMDAKTKELMSRITPDQESRLVKELRAVSVDKTCFTTNSIDAPEGSVYPLRNHMGGKAEHVGAQSLYTLEEPHVETDAPLASSELSTLTSTYSTATEQDESEPESEAFEPTPGDPQSDHEDPQISGLTEITQLTGFWSNSPSLDGYEIDNARDSEEMPSEEEIKQQKIINEEYKTWKKNSPLLYDFILTRALEWPTLTVQWLPDKQGLPDKHFSTHRLLIGTHTSDDLPNYLQIANVQLPNPVSAKAADYDADREEIGGYNGSQQPISFEVIQKIPHPGEVNKARYQPQNPNLIATWCQDGMIRLWDRTKHPSDPGPNAAINAQAELKGHEKEGFGMNWSSSKEGQLATGGEDQTVRVWNVQDYSSSSKPIEPRKTWSSHSATVNDVQHHPILDWAIGSVSDDCTFQLHDDRIAPSKRAAREANGHTDAVNALAFHPEEEVLFATGSADHHIRIWDLRNLKMSVALLETHFESVQTVEWDPHHYHILGSAGQDRRVLFWDLSKIGDEQTPEDAEDGPAELMFMHAGHTAAVSDFSWNKTIPWTICSASEDNLIEIWQPNKQTTSPPRRKANQTTDNGK